MTTRQIVLRLREHSGLNQVEFGKAIGVSGTAVMLWEHGKRIAPFNRMRLLAFARSKNAPPDLVAALEQAQPELSQ